MTPAVPAGARAGGDFAGTSPASRRRPFPLVIYYMLASVVVITIALFVVIRVASSSEQRSVISRIEFESDGEARLVAFDLAERLSLLSVDGAGLALDFVNDREGTQRAVLNSIRGRPIIRVDVLDHAGDVVYSTDHSARGLRPLDDPFGLMTAIETGSVSRYDTDRPITLPNGATGTFDVVESLVPLFPEGTADAGLVEPYAIVSIYHDVTESVSRATAGVERVRMLSVGATMAALFMVLLGVVIQGQRVIRRSEARLAEALDHARAMGTTLDEQNRRLTEANESKIRFLSAVTHELKTPLTGIVAFVDLLRRNRDRNLTGRQLEQLTIVQRNGRRLDSLVNDLLDLSRIERGTFGLSPSRWEVAPFIAEIAVSVDAMYAGRKQTLHCIPVDPSLQLMADRERTGQVVVNLLSNASKYSADGASVTLTAWPDDGRIYFSVADSGIGIAPEHQSKLFAEFYRVASPETHGIPGSGLGLAIVRSIVQRHGGEVTVSSVPGRGSTFTFWLPAGLA